MADVTDDMGAPGGGDDTENQYPGDSSGHLNPALQSFVGQQDTAEGQAWAGAAADRLQTYLTARSNAVDAEKAATDFTNNLVATRDGLVNMVRQEPSSIDVALDLAGHAVNGMVASHGHLDDDTRQQAADDLIGHFQGQIVHGAVQSLAEMGKAPALAALDKYGSYLPDGEDAALRQYADVQEAMRGADGAATSLQQQKDQAAAGYQSASRYLGAMVDPTTGEYRVPQGFLQNLVSDPSVAPTTGMALRAGYAMLNRFGDVPQSNPQVVSDLIGRIADPMTPTPKQGEIISHLGSGLTVNDAVFLNHLIGPNTPQNRAMISQLGDVMSTARGALMTQANGSAGAAAYGRFTSALLPALQAGANLNELTQGNYLQSFAPTKEDYKPAARPMTLAGDVQPLRPGSPFGYPGGVTGDLLDRMRELGDTGYSVPGRLPVTRPDNTMVPRAANDTGAG